PEPYGSHGRRANGARRPARRNELVRDWHPSGSIAHASLRYARSGWRVESLPLPGWGATGGAVRAAPPPIRGSDRLRRSPAANVRRPARAWAALSRLTG